MIDYVICLYTMQSIDMIMNFSTIELHHQVPSHLANESFNFEELVDLYRSARQVHDSRPTDSSLMKHFQLTHLHMGSDGNDSPGIVDPQFLDSFKDNTIISLIGIRLRNDDSLQ
ncbi:hypothetical protein GCM10007160_24870 [Litchfieldella qijiaojingensis]|uniref:Uncharacterized protein n=1 Tax=Litchfieldella qijiaojingensis TaxID=980347 RepID=A0ABQ2YX44_9GAMM|nr:hypothetical protein GCM10007160_24870 [Halomonas qijiaojingensis]